MLLNILLRLYFVGKMSIMRLCMIEITKSTLLQP